MPRATTPDPRQRFRSMLAIGITATLGAVLAPTLLGRPLWSLVVMAAWGYWRAWVWYAQVRAASVEKQPGEHVGKDAL